MKENSIIHPSDMLLLGEKTAGHGDYYMDLNEGKAGNDFDGILDQSSHNALTQDRVAGVGSGGANYAITDGSARFIKFPGALDPAEYVGRQRCQSRHVQRQLLRIKKPAADLRRTRRARWRIFFDDSNCLPEHSWHHIGP